VRFFGQFLQRVDAKHRVAVPASFRQAIGEAQLRKGLVLTRGFDRCLYLFPAGAWDLVTGEFASVLFKGRDARMLERLFLGEAVELAADPAGRIVLPGPLRAMAGLGERALFLGASSRIEIWEPARWQALEKPAIERYEELAEAFHRLLHGRKKA
jgi:MraZ protein